VTPPTAGTRTGDAEDRRIRRSWLVFAGSFLALGVLATFRVVLEPTDSMSWLTAGLIVLVGLAAVANRFAVQALEAGRRAEAESFARILQGLSRSVSPDAIMDAIVEEIGTGTGADHIVVVRRRPETRVLQATLVNARTGGPGSSTLFPISDLEDPPDITRVRRDPTPIAIDPGAEPVLVAFGRGPTARPARRRPDRRVENRGLAAASRPSGAAGARRGGAPGGAAASAVELLLARSRLTDPALVVAERIAARTRNVYGLKHTLTAPLTADGTVIGAIVVSRRTAGPWPASAQRILAGSAAEASSALSRAYSHRAAEARASTDALTGLPNRRYFDEFCALLARRRRSEDAIGVLMVDIDRFKALNDTHGHAVGDEVLRAVAGAIARAVREDDVPARFGGEEFAVLLRNPSPAEAIEVGERVRHAVAGLDLSEFGVASASVSVGVAVATAPDQAIDDLVEHADRALYAAKRAGRDRVVAA
jgi:diguanylate cyclase (GGDEF)-like protein